jgi:hypothetical protein
LTIFQCFISGGNRRTQRKPPTCSKSLTNFITYCWMTESTFGHCYHFIHECHNDAKYFGTLLSSYTCVSQWHNVHWHIVIISYMCGTMTPSALTHCYNLIPVCHNDTKYIDTLLSSYTCVPQWHKVDWYIVIILNKYV